ncbi:hypothetical protein Slin15195_G130020 [Septoria linicola]|uniref:Uncharacterized protein n=1 Tax=Septoria linicola TaxID=215465 RepID=A0A9Q9B969_9PEZI|nr:hypothetical protein Slin14017_G129030 [Septoria linicola]USW59683.1 hypothetical protein Slin15195_G130020 [Septoria linicola]
MQFFTRSFTTGQRRALPKLPHLKRIRSNPGARAAADADQARAFHAADVQLRRRIREEPLKRSEAVSFQIRRPRRSRRRGSSGSSKRCQSFLSHLKLEPAEIQSDDGSEGEAEGEDFGGEDGGAACGAESGHAAPAKPADNSFQANAGFPADEEVPEFLSHLKPEPAETRLEHGSKNEAEEEGFGSEDGGAAWGNEFQTDRCGGRVAQAMPLDALTG